MVLKYTRAFFSFIENLFIFSLLFLFLIPVQLIYSIKLTSGVQYSVQQFHTSLSTHHCKYTFYPLYESILTNIKHGSR